jgi:hypothetical protein
MRLRAVSQYPNKKKVPKCGLKRLNSGMGPDSQNGMNNLI